MVKRGTSDHTVELKQSYCDAIVGGRYPKKQKQKEEETRPQERGNIGSLQEIGQ